MLISNLHKKNILVLGIGEEGLDSLLFLKNNVAYKKIGVADKLPFEEINTKYKKHLQQGVELHFGENYLSAIKNYDVIVKSPGVPLHLLKLNNKNQILTSQSDLFLTNCKGSVIGVTGTKGKSTTSLLIYNILAAAGKTVYLIGNIGNPALSRLQENKRENYFIYELSSFQLETVKSSPHIAVFLNVFVDHLDQHKTFKEYLAAKEKITVFQKEKDYLIYNQKDEKVVEIAKNSRAQKIPFSFNEKRERIPVFIDPVLEVAKILKIDEKEVEKAFSDFQGLPHREEYIGNYRGIYFYNDSAATIPEATIHAIDNLKGVQTIILGGSEKGADIKSLIEKIKESSTQNIIIFKGTPSELTEEIKKTSKTVFLASNMEEAVRCCFDNTDEGKKCLLSPGFASFNMFKNYKERGELFKKYVQELSV